MEAYPLLNNDGFLTLADASSALATYSETRAAVFEAAIARTANDHGMKRGRT